MNNTIMYVTSTKDNIFHDITHGNFLAIANNNSPKDLKASHPVLKNVFYDPKISKKVSISGLILNSEVNRIVLDDTHAIINNNSTWKYSFQTIT